MNEEDVVADTIIAALSEKIDIRLLDEAFTRPIREAVYKNLTKELFYLLLKEKKLNLLSGFGTILIKDTGGKEKKVYDKKSGKMVLKKVKKTRIIYKSGDFIKPFL